MTVKIKLSLHCDTCKKQFSSSVYYLGSLDLNELSENIDENWIIYTADNDQEYHFHDRECLIKFMEKKGWTEELNKFLNDVWIA